MNTEQFSIEIVDQGWLKGSTAEADLCSHGRIRLVIGGRTIADDSEQYGISESALALLRTLEADHSRARPVAERLVFHGCGTILMMGCPIGLDWSVTHGNGDISLGHVVRYPTTNEAHAQEFSGLHVTLSEAQYRDQVVRFASTAQSLFAGLAKTFSDDWDRQEYEKFWLEFNTIMGRQRSVA